ncbi:Argonaute complex, subunit Arb1 [Aspergillus granulosus]|uniref:Argonaute complex, subunit Arb1 n=1 Tax=Aspergillus granulosus TaxID=176169 RepID=A0ABR4I1R8_9EURO
MEGQADIAEEILEETAAPRSQNLPRKKKNRRPKSKRGKNKPTGFEEYYVDAPITVEEHQLERELYHVSRPIIHRVEDALLRFHRNRRIETDRLEVFHKYLTYGGVDVGPNMFAGSDNRDLKEMDSEQILRARARTAISQESSHLAIDFDAVVKGFLTSYFPFYFNPENEAMINLATVTIRSFLSYLLYHDVCPEHKENIHEARKSCDIATKELWKNQQLTANGPGDFNIACSTLFGGLEHEVYAENNEWKNPEDDKIQMTKDIAEKVIRFGLAVAGSDEIASSFHQMDSQGSLEATILEDLDGFEVTGVRLLSERDHEFYLTNAPDLNPVGRLYGRTYYDPDMSKRDLSPDEQEQWAVGDRPVQEFTFFLEESLLKHCYPGMKIIAPIWELSCGFHYFEDITRAYCSIYMSLPNDLMIGWKKPRDLAAKGKNQEAWDEEAE